MSFLWILPAILVVGLVLVLVTLPNTPEAPARHAKMTPERAETVAKAFCRLLAELPADAIGPMVSDASDLPHTKEEIDEALIMCVQLAADEEGRTAFGGAYISLADWQPGAAGGIALDRLADAALKPGGPDTGEVERMLTRFKVDQKWMEVAAAERTTRFETLRRLRAMMAANLTPRDFGLRPPKEGA